MATASLRLVFSLFSGVAILALGSTVGAAPLPDPSCYPPDFPHNAACVRDSSCCAIPIPGGNCQSLADAAAAEAESEGFGVCEDTPEDQSLEDHARRLGAMRRLLLTKPDGWSSAELALVEQVASNQPRNFHSLTSSLNRTIR